MVLAILAGAVCGFVGYVPFWFASRRSKKVDPSIGSAGYGLWFLFAIVVSFIVLVAFAFAASALTGAATAGDKGPLYGFLAAEIAVWLALVIIFGLLARSRRRK